MVSLDVDEVKKKSKRDSPSKLTTKEHTESQKSENLSSDSFDASFFQDLMKEDGMNLKD